MTQRADGRRPRRARDKVSTHTALLRARDKVSTHTALLRARDKVSTHTALLRALARVRREGQRIVFTNGCFDLLHPGHVRSLEQAAGLGDVLVVAVNGDRSVARLKGSGRPALPARVRCELVAALGCVDWVVPFDADTPARLIARVRPDVLAKGGDWPLDAIVGRDTVEAAGGRVVRLDQVPGPRSSDWLKAIRRRR